MHPRLTHLGYSGFQRHSCPAVAAVCRVVQAASVRPSVQFLRIARTHSQGANVQRGEPGIDGLKRVSVVGAPPYPSRSSDVEHVGPSRMDDDATDENLVSGRKRSFTESTLTVQSFNSIESYGGAQSKGTVESIPDDNDLLSSILGI